ncbi:ATP phosphoribosyltransferase regulatory subunit [Geoalkalibacter halelectricus]|uniref:ATP phosphoribosyltransferase regulatory subunit n=1 Tax=Geoalkalibacter halelectricus TaxID=2847045 RepID=A0ABY5ZNC8_9BACT|nr:ATP phosphoribosyltransferase regulatory subunit [Geoalkalibacter halelectricus]MDO3378681.1 ATP phosphoribosyltransferase regulatory subunit [Geoalkalibacter halelectricus]UWZ80009.1 ATP phosphoribosyltransferase regulatory subunit [Geoalkalibacter halelectricus]
MKLPSAVPENMLPRGVKDFLPVKAAKIEYLKHSLLDVFAQWGFRPVLPPSLEYLHVLEKALGAGLRERTFRFDDRQGGQLVAIPPDITPQVARIVATRMREFPLPLRLCYAGRVLRHAEQQTGKDREILQAGVELIGLQSPEADAEMIAMAVEGLKAVGAREFTVDIGQVEFFRGVMDGLSLSGELAREVAHAIGHKDTSGLQALLAEAPISTQAREEISLLPRLFGGREVLEQAAAVVRNERSRRALDNLARVLDILAVYEVEEHVTIDLGEIRGLDYHTGITFQGFLPGIGRAVCSGGRYDDLTARYGYPAPATGFAFNLLNLLFALEGEIEEQTRRCTDVLIFQSGADKVLAQRLARLLRSAGFSAARDIYPRGLEETLDYARKMSFRYVMTLGRDDEAVRIIRMADGVSLQADLQDILAGDFAFLTD